MSGQDYCFQARLWIWNGGTTASWYFVTLPDEIGREIKFFSGLKQGFGSVRVEAHIGSTRWQTSLFPNKGTQTYLLPVKASVRQAEALALDQLIDVRLVTKSA